METGLNSFASPDAIGPMYPFVGSEVFLTIVAVALWIIWHIWEVGYENRDLRESQRKARENKS